MASTRRMLLSALSAVGLGGLAGCSGSSNDSGDDPSSDGESTTSELAADPSLATKLTAPDGAANAAFGRAVSVSGTTAAILSVRPQNSNDDGDIGTVHVVGEDDGSWSQRTALPTAPQTYFQRNSIAIDDDTIVLGGSPATVFERSDGSWSQQTTLSPAGAKADLDGDTAVLNDGEEAFVFTRSDGSWSRQTTLEYSGSQRPTGEIALDDGTVFVESSSSIFVFDRDGSEWTQTVELTGDGLDAYDTFGTAIEVHGNTAAIGVRTSEEHSANEVRVLEHTDGSWSRQATVTDDETSGTGFGEAISLTDSTLLVGARDEDGTGVAYVFKRSDGDWQRESQLVPDDGGDGDDFGNAVALGAGIGVVGSRYHNTEAGETAGAAYVSE